MFRLGDSPPTCHTQQASLRTSLRAVPELCFKVISATDLPNPAHEVTARAVAVRGLATLVWRHQRHLLSNPHLHSQLLHDRVLTCLEGARASALTGVFLTIHLSPHQPYFCCRFCTSVGLSSPTL